MTKSTRQRRALLAALLGPGETEVTCEECFDLLDRYVDLAAAADDQAESEADRAVPGMLAHLAGCPACREDHQSLRDLVRADADLGTNSTD
jgi:hypothetical protein